MQGGEGEKREGREWGRGAERRKRERRLREGRENPRVYL